MTGRDDSYPLRLRTYVALLVATMVTTVATMEMLPESSDPLWMIPIVVFIFLGETFFEREDRYVAAVLLSYFPYGERVCDLDPEHST